MASRKLIGTSGVERVGDGRRRGSAAEALRLLAEIPPLAKLRQALYTARVEATPVVSA
jgi:hypothetical protein